MARKISMGILAIFLIIAVAPVPAHSQKKKFNLKKGKELFNKVKTMTNTEEPQKKNEGVKLPSTEGMDGENHNKRKLTPPDVNEQIVNARAAYSANSYSEARFYIKEAIKGIELEIGNKILESMPAEVMDAKYEESEDEVFSTGVGFAGMSVGRTYYGNDGSISATVANSSALAGAANIALYSGNYSAYDENVKVTRYKDQKAIIELDEYSGYTLSVPFGQSSVFILKCEICQSEGDLTTTADKFDIEKYKKLLGEQ